MFEYLFLALRNVHLETNILPRQFTSGSDFGTEFERLGLVTDPLWDFAKRFGI